jgi:hypothetical protein
MKVKKLQSSKNASDEKYINARTPKTPVTPLFTFDRDGRVADIHTKHYGWRPIKEVNVYFLQKILEYLENADKKYSHAWYAVDQELKRRPAIKPRTHEHEEMIA